MKRTITLRYLFTLCVMTLVSAFWGGNLASAEEVTLTGDDLGMKNWDYLGGNTYTASGIKFSVGGTGTTPQYKSSTIRLYSGNTFTIEMEDETSIITKIEFTSTHAADNIKADNGGSYANYVWTAGAEALSSVNFTVSGKIFISKFVVTYKSASADTRQNVTLSMPESANIDVFETFDAAENLTLTVPDGGDPATGAITYSIEPATGDFNFDSETGKFTANKTEGSYTIKASFKGDDNYYGDEASTTVKVSSRVRAQKHYVPVTDLSQIVDGGQYLLAYDDGSYYNVMSTFNINIADNISLRHEDYKNGDLMKVDAESAGGMPIVLEAVGGYFALKIDKGYLQCNIGEDEKAQEGLNVSITSASRAAQWTIDIDREGNAHIINKYAPTFELYFCSGKVMYYFLASEGGTSCYRPKLYVKCADMSFKAQALGYATYADNFAYQMPAGVKGYAIAGLNESDNTKLVKEVAYSAGELVPAFTPLLVYNENVAGADVTAYPILVNKKVDAYKDKNYLEFKRNAENMTDSQLEGAVKYYKLTKNASEDKPLGFYLGAEGGAAFAMTKSSSAYLALPQSINAAAGLLFDEAGEATGIQLTPAGETAAPAVYNLQGVRVSGKLAKGLYIVNGKKVLVK